MPVSLIVAAAGPNFIIGNKGDLPWHFPADLKFFKQKTLGQTVVMGRVTYDSIFKRLGKPLPNRRNVVLTNNLHFSAEGIEIIHNFHTFIAQQKDEEIFVIGGASLYHTALPLADTIYFTYVDQVFEGDATFPPFGPPEWQLHSESQVIDQNTNLFFRTYNKA